MANFSLPSNFYYRDPSNAQKSIRAAWICGLLSGGLTLAATLAAMGSTEMAVKTGFGSWNLLDVILVFGLTWGIFCKNRACAIIMFVYFGLSKVIQITTGIANPVAIVVGILFAWVYFNGIRGTFTYYKLKRMAK
jgi:hypothetical protein